MDDPYKEALGVQDACNFSGVALGFARLVEELNWRAPAGVNRNDYLRFHPAVFLWMDKMADMMRRPWENECSAAFYSWAFDACQVGEALPYPLWWVEDKFSGRGWRYVGTFQGALLYAAALCVEEQVLTVFDAANRKVAEVRWHTYRKEFCPSWVAESHRMLMGDAGEAYLAARRLRNPPAGGNGGTAAVSGESEAAQ